MSSWTCPQCTFSNESGLALNCIVCGFIKPSSNGWKCLNCTFENFTQSQTCQVCDNPKPLQNTNINPLIIDEDNNNAFWVCPECTFTNNESVNKNRCDLCDGKRETMTLGGYDYDDDNDNDNDNNIIATATIELPKNAKYEHFESVLNIIVAHAPNHKAAITVLKSLNKITCRVSDEKPKYRILDTTTHGVQTKLLGFEGSIEYLQLLGYALDGTLTKLQCIKHPPQHILDKVIAAIDLHLKTQRAMIKDLKKKEEKQQEKEKEQKEEKDQEEDLKLDCGDFTLAQLVGLLTHETLTFNGINNSDHCDVLLLCHRCFSHSLELIEAIRKRFFVPAPISACSWCEEEIISWCQTIQRPIQNKCVQILCEWITNYFYVDFYLQSNVLTDLQKFTKQVLECKYESDDGWYDSLATLLTSAIESGQKQIKQQIKHNVKHNAYDNVYDLLQINYGFLKKKRKKKEKKATTEILLIYQYSAIEMAQQISLIDFEYFSCIHSREFLNKVWKNNNNNNNNLNNNLNAMICRFNCIHRFVVLSLIICHRLSDRVLILSHFIEMSLNLLELRNFFSLMAVFSALDSISISKLKYLWLRLDIKYKSLLNNLSTVCDAKSNFKSLRKLMRRSYSSRLPTIPYIGLFLSDLTFVNQGAAKLDYGFINFKRFERFNERCKIVASFQKIFYTQKKNNLSSYIENDINIFNNEFNDDTLKILLANSIQNDEKNATNSERQTIKTQSKKKKSKKSKFKKFKK